MSHFDDLQRFYPLSMDAYERLCAYVALLEKWQKTTNLISNSTVSSIWTRHVADSLQVLRLQPSAQRWIDMGSGAGFPAIVLAIAGFENGLHVSMIESNAKKAAFLREAVRVTGVNAHVYGGRIEDVVENLSVSYEVVSARALASLSKLIEFSFPLLSKGAQALFPKGQDVDIELTQAAQFWNIRYEKHQSLTDPAASILQIYTAVPVFSSD